MIQTINRFLFQTKQYSIGQKYDSFPLQTEKCFLNERTTWKLWKLHVGNYKNSITIFESSYEKVNTFIQENRSS